MEVASAVLTPETRCFVLVHPLVTSFYVHYIHQWGAYGVGHSVKPIANFTALSSLRGTETDALNEVVSIYVSIYCRVVIFLFRVYSRWVHAQKVDPFGSTTTTKRTFLMKSSAAALLWDAAVSTAANYRLYGVFLAHRCAESNFPSSWSCRINGV